MDGNHPKRRKAKDNPYTISELNGRYFLSFRDGQGVLHNMEIQQDLFSVMDTFELEDLSFMNEWDRHYEQSELTEASLNKRAAQRAGTVEEVVEQHMEHEALHRAINTLPVVQRRRLTLYFFGELTYEQIAKMEGCTIMPVKRSIDAAIEKIKFFLK